MWKEIEDNAFENQADFEQSMLELYKTSPEETVRELTDYSKQTAEDAVEAYWQLGDDLWTIFNRYF